MNHLIFNGYNYGSMVCESGPKWGISRTVTNVYGISVIRILDSYMLGCVADELALIFGLYRTGTLSLTYRGHRYTCYSFMTGEYPYKVGTDYELDEIVYHWKIYYGWWNVKINDSDIYVRNYYGKKVLVVYPPCSWKSADIIDKDSYEVSMPCNTRSNLDILETWINCYNDVDKQKFIDNIRTKLCNIIERINPELLHIGHIIMSRIKSYIMYDM